MKLSVHSRARLLTSLKDWDVSGEHVDPMYNYLVYAFSPGGFFTSVLANDFMGAMARSHPANSVVELKKLSAWIQARVPEQAKGSYLMVDQWCDMQDDQRRAILVADNLIYTPEQEMMLALTGNRVCDPVFI